MADMMEWASRWLESQRTQFMTRSVEYRRGTDAVVVAASIGKTVFELDDGYGAVLRTESRDFLILTADLILNGVNVQPKRGDQIRETMGSTVFVYEVLAPGKEPEWRFSDPYRQTYRIHTKHIGTEAA